MGFGGLSIATSGIRVAQRNLNVTGHNIANSEVAGFSRQRIIQNTATSRCMGLSAGGGRMQVGMGADWSEVHQIRNEFLDINFRNNVSQLQFYSTKVQAGHMVQTLLGELHGAYRFQDAINNIWYSMQELTSMPESLAHRQFFISNANTFLTKAHDVFNGLIEYQLNLDQQIRDMVNGRNGINATVAAIGELNLKIRFHELSGERANDYRDERHRLLDHLATMIPIDVWQGPNGDMNITSLGHHILTGNHQSVMGLRYIANEISFVEPVFTNSRDILSAGTPPSEFTSYMDWRNPIDPTRNNDRGRLIALLQSRGSAPANHLSESILPPLHPDRIAQLAEEVPGILAAFPPVDSDGTLIGDMRASILAINTAIALETDEDIIAGLEATRATLQEALSHAERDPNHFIRRLIDAAGDAPLTEDLMREIDRDFHAQTHNHRAFMWSLDNSMITQVQLNKDRIVNSVVTMLNDAFTGNLRGEDGNFLFFETEYTLNANGERVPVLDADGRRIPVLAYEADGITPIIDPVTGQQARIPIRPTDGNNPPRYGIPLFIRDVDVRDGVHDNWPLRDIENPNRVDTIFTTSNIRINPEFLLPGGHNNLALSLSGAPGDTDLLVALHGVWMSSTSHYSISIFCPESGGRRSFNMQDAYKRMIGSVATVTSRAGEKVTTQTIQVDQAHNQRMAIKGVSMDEEMSAMLRFQFAFQAASRAFNVIDSMIDRLINGTGRVGL